MPRRRGKKRNDEKETRSDRETVLYTPMHLGEKPRLVGGSDDGDEGDRGREWGERDESGGRFGKEGRVSSSCNAIDPVAVHHVDTILVRSFQIAGVVGVGFCAITSVAGPIRTHARTPLTHTRACRAA